VKANARLWYLAEFFLEWEMFQTKVVQQNKTHILCSVTILWKSCRLWDNVGKYGTAGQITDYNIRVNVQRGMHCECWVTKATDTHSEYLIAIVFQLQN
jgi:hypothetical protein